jgi:hypothetical protein
MAIEFDDAVQFAKTMIQEQLQRSKTLPTGQDHAVGLASNYWFSADPKGMTRQAEHDAIAFDALRLGISARLEMGKELPQPVCDWLVRYLRYEVGPPKGKSGPNQHRDLHFAIWFTVEELVDLGMTASRNDSNQDEYGKGKSACDAVAKALEELELSPTSYFTVKRIVSDYKKARKID